MLKDGKTCFRFCGNFAVAAIFVLIGSGCSTVENSSYQTVAAHLDAGGGYYRISDGSGFYRTVGNLVKKIKLSLYTQTLIRRRALTTPNKC